MTCGLSVLGKHSAFFVVVTGLMFQRVLVMVPTHPIGGLWLEII